jgi:hypothetical protein
MKSLIIFKGKNQMSNKDCDNCKIEVCPAKCFNRHKWSMIALRKLADKIEKENQIKQLWKSLRSGKVEKFINERDY